MQWLFYRIPVAGGDAASEFNHFLRTVRVLTVHREFVSQGESSFWAMAVEYIPSAGTSPGSKKEPPAKANVDFKSILAPDDFSLYARLREWRKETGNTEAVPVYTFFTNEQLAEMARRRCSSLAALKEIDGISQGRLDKYGSAVLAIIMGMKAEPQDEPFTAD